VIRLFEAEADDGVDVVPYLAAVFQLNSVELHAEISECAFYAIAEE
jgi:hypothetical protein